MIINKLNSNLSRAFKKSLKKLISNRRLNVSIIKHQSVTQLNNRIKDQSRPKLILGIETSCDDTCASVLDTDGRILSNEKSSQIQNVIECGGVMTVSSIRLHSMAIHDVVLNALKKVGIKSFKELSAIAITVKPGQTVSLDIGLEYAKHLALSYKLALIPIHHMEAHALTAMICHKELNFPFLALLISGGHSQIALFKNLDLIYLIGDSFDSGPGELIDKIARNLKIKNLGHPFNQQSGGQSVEMLAKLYKDNKLKFKDLNHNKISNCNFNFGGIKTRYNFEIKKLRKENESYPLNTIKDNGFKSIDVDTPLDETCFLCAELQFNLVNMFTDRLERAIKFIEMSNILDKDVKKKEDIKLKEIDLLNQKPIELSLVVSGGVACNDTIMNELEEKLKSTKGFYDETKFKFYLPRPFYLCTDNASMIAWNGVLKYLESVNHLSTNNYLLADQNEIKNLKSDCNAKLGVNIADLVKKIRI